MPQPRRKAALLRFPKPFSGAEAALYALPLPVLLVDAEGRIAYLNLEAEQYFRLSAALAVGRPLTELASELAGPVARAMGPGQPLVTDHGLTITLAPGEIRETAVRAAIAGEGGLVALTLLPPPPLPRATPGKGVGPMAAVLAHEIKNPLSGIRGAAQLLGAELAPEDRELSDLILAEADRIRGLLDRMQIFEEAPPAALSAVNIHECLDQVIRAAEAGYGAGTRIRRLYDPSLPPVLGETGRLAQIFSNLLKNAVEAAEPGDPRIEIATAYVHGPRLARGGTARADCPLRVTVADNGPGIPEALRPHIFTPFLTSKSGGTGLGLALAAKLAGDLGGTLELESRPGRTAFHVHLPRAEG
jgi:two-component system nitrogen regulation sensor histidine kinase GlnL